MDIGIDGAMMEWVRGVAGDCDVVLALPTAASPQRPTVCLWLLDVRPRPGPRQSRSDPLQLTLTYLVTAAAPDAAGAHDLLAELAFAALQEPDVEVEPEPTEPALWAALGVPPTAALRLRVVASRARPWASAPQVLRPLIVRDARMGRVTGWVRSPDDIGIADATVELPALDRRARTDARGRFSIEAVPIGDGRLDVRVRAKGREVWSSIDEPNEHELVAITLDPREDSNGGLPHP